MTRESLRTQEFDHTGRQWYYKIEVDKLLNDLESRTCEGCQDYVDGICTDSKGHYCIRNTSMEDRYVPKFERKDK